MLQLLMAAVVEGRGRALGRESLAQALGLVVSCCILVLI